VTIHILLDTIAGPGTHLVDLLDRDMLEAHAGLPVYMRGVDYAVHGRVTDIGLTTHRATAAVLGTRPYDVIVEHVGPELACSCSCPAGDTDTFCKHLVALGIELLGDIRGDPEPDLSTLRTAIADAFSWGRHDSYGYVHYRDAYAWRYDIESVIGELTNLLDAGFAAEAVDLTEMVLAALNDSVEHVDDSDGHLHDLAGRRGTCICAPAGAPHLTRWHWQGVCCTGR
jgi:hypothetical protein